MTNKTFNENDRVKLVRKNQWGGPALGSEGTIVPHWRNTDTLLLVNFDGFEQGHDGECDYLTGTKSFWFVFVDEIELVKKPRKELQPMTKQVLEHLVTVGNISGIEAIGMYKVRSLTKQISMIREAGYPVQSEWKRDATGQRYKRYYLSTDAVAA